MAVGRQGEGGAVVVTRIMSTDLSSYCTIVDDKSASEGKVKCLFWGQALEGVAGEGKDAPVMREVYERRSEEDT